MMYSGEGRVLEVRHSAAAPVYLHSSVALLDKTWYMLRGNAGKDSTYLHSWLTVNGLSRPSIP